MPRVDIARLGALLRFPGARLVPQNSERPTYYFRIARYPAGKVRQRNSSYPADFLGLRGAS